MELIVVNSNSSGNAYALVSKEREILLLEAGCKMADVKRCIDYRIQDVVGCLLTHCHGDHAKYATEYAKFGVEVYGPKDIEEKKSFPFGKYHVLILERTKHIGGFDVVPFHNFHDVEIYGYMLRHKEMGTMIFSSDTYKMGLYVSGVDHYLIEANYSDVLLKDNVWNGNINKAQADRIMISHMSFDYTVKYLRDCKADESAKTIILCHLSERNSDPEQFQKTVASTFGVPCYCARKGLVVELNKELL